MKRRDVGARAAAPESAEAGAEILPEPVARVAIQRGAGDGPGDRPAGCRGQRSRRAAPADDGRPALVELAADLVDASSSADRLAPTEDADYRRLVDSIRDAGQQAAASWCARIRDQRAATRSPTATAAAMPRPNSGFRCARSFVH